MRTVRGPWAGPVRSLIAGAVRRHWLFGLAMAGGVAVRVITMLAFRPVLWFGGDSASYVATALRLVPDRSRTGGYGLLLTLLRPLHTFTAVAVVQHLMGLAMGVMIYSLARRYRIPAWGATLATLPVLFDAYQIQLEHDVVPDVVFSFLVMLALTLILRAQGTRQPGAGPRERPCPAEPAPAPSRSRARLAAFAAAGLLLGASAAVWPVGLPLLVIVLIVLALTRAGWKMVVVTLLAGAVPLAGYAAWFNGTYHQVALTESDGAFLWGRVISFADCAVIRPPPAEKPLCPTPGQPAGAYLVWMGGSPVARMPGGAFGSRTNRLALAFSLRAIAAQPGGYLSTVLGDFAKSYTWNRPANPKYEFSSATTHWAPGTLRTTGHGTLLGDQLAYTRGSQAATRAVQPYAGWMRGYQRYVYLRGTLLALILLAGLAGGAVRAWLSWRRRDPGERRGRGWLTLPVLPWVAAVTALLVPPAVAGFDTRYVVPTVPVACLAAVLAVPCASAASPADAVFRTHLPAGPGRSAQVHHVARSDRHQAVRPCAWHRGRAVRRVRGPDE